MARGRGTVQQKKRIHQLILDRPKDPRPEEASLYDIEQKPFSGKFHQTISSSRKPAVSFRASTNQQQHREEKKEERAESSRYHSL